MNTNQLKRFAQAARTKLIEQVGAKLDFVLHTDSAELREKADSLNQLQEAINATSKVQVIEKVAYTWFNRLMALRFMDVNDYQPIGIRVVTPKDGYTLPEILEEAKHGHISDELQVNRNLVFEILDGIKPSVNPQNEAYKLLLIGACNHLNNTFPFLFERINDYTELLMPDDLISQYSIVQDIRDGMAAEDCQEVEIIGWLYQFYISEKKDEVFASKSAVKKEDIPAATQLFTPRWIVEYMVQNTVGKLWLQNRPSSKIRQYMPYYIESASSTATDYLKLNSIEELRLLDQACGSGHILVYGFDLLYKIYEEEGYNPTDIPQLIVEKNLYGFEIDERASQLAGLALMMKARSYHRRFFRKEVEPNILCYSDMKLSEAEVKEIFTELGINLPDNLNFDLNLIRQATNLGSLIQPQTSIETLNNILEQLENKLKTATIFTQPKINAIQLALLQLTPLIQKYHCIVDNPPYMGSGNMNKELSDFVKSNYPDSKSDLMACFMEAGLEALHPKGFLGMINQHSWMFLSSYERLRAKLIDTVQFDTLLHLGPRTFPEIGGEVVQNASFTFINTPYEYKGIYIRLLDFENSELKRCKFIEANLSPKCKWLFCANQGDYKRIPGSPIGYWLNSNYLNIFEESPNLSSAMNSGGRCKTHGDLQFLRFFWEVNNIKLNNKWKLYNKGGESRKWYGNLEYTINWSDEARYSYSVHGGLSNSMYWNKIGITWSGISSNESAYRLKIKDSEYASASPTIIVENEIQLYFTLGFLNSKVSRELMSVINPTIQINVGDALKLPLRTLADCSLIEKIVKDCICILETEWDLRENSHCFKQNPLIQIDHLDLCIVYNKFKNEWNNNYINLHSNEEELNRLFIDLYGLQDELSPDVPLEDITILKEETSIENGELVFHADEVLAQFISYAVGCMFGRYSLDKPGLILANQGETLKEYLEKLGADKSELSFLPDEDNIIPILDDEWFEDDIVNRFTTFLKASFGKDNFEKNLAFVEESLGMEMRKYFTRNFYADHIKRYKKRPIYWMFSSSKGSFNVLIYMHRYTPDTLNKILKDYLREYKEKISAYKDHLNHQIETGTSSEATKAAKQLDKYKQILLELQDYEREILLPLATERITIDLDNGVLVNYNLFGKAIKEVPGLNDKATKKKVKEFDWINADKIV